MEVLFCVDGLSFFYDTDICLTGIDLNFITVIVIEFGRSKVTFFFPCHMDTFAVCEVVAVLCGIVALEGQIAFFVSRFIVCELYKDVFECELGIGCAVHVFRIALLHTLETVVKSVFLIVLKIGLGDRVCAG